MGTRIHDHDHEFMMKNKKNQTSKQKEKNTGEHTQYSMHAKIITWIIKA